MFPAARLGVFHLGAFHLAVCRLGVFHLGAFHLAVCRLEVVHLGAFHLAVFLPVASPPAVCHWAAHPGAGPEIGKACRKKAVRRRAARRAAAAPNLLQTPGARR